MRLDILVRNSVLGLALAGLITAGPVQAQNKDAAKDAAKAEKDATKDAANAQEGRGQGRQGKERQGPRPEREHQ